MKINVTGKVGLYVILIRNIHRVIIGMIVKISRQKFEL